MDVSVVVPTRNRSSLLATTLRSVLRQRGLEFEVLVVDDGSTDGTSRVIDSFGDRRLRTIHHPTPLGPNAARNRGAQESQGEWLAFVDDDDVWSPDKVVKQLRAAVDSRADWVYAGSVNVNERLEIVHGSPPPTPEKVVALLPRFNPIPASASNVAIRRTTFLGAEGFNETLRTCEEWDLWLRLAVGGAPAWVPSPLVAYRMHSGNAILDVAAIIEGARMIEELHGTTIDWGLFHRWLAQLCIRGGRRGAALGQYFRAALRGQGRQAGGELAGLAYGAIRRRLGFSETPSARRSDTGWEELARGWIEELQRLDADPVGGPR
jgi:glycosyltransferase involved in cell wall biosynthesis